MKSLIFLKLGGSLITDKSQPYTTRPEVIERVCKEIHEARNSRPIPLLIGHGGGSFPHVSAKKYETHKGIIADESWEGFVQVQDDAARLNRILVSALLASGERALSFQPSASCLARKDRIVQWYTKPIAKALEHGLIPVPFGDVCFDLHKGCCIISTEEALRFLADKLRPVRIIMVGKTDGVLDAKGAVIPEITRKNLREVSKLLQPSDGVADVTGGMIQKVSKSFEFGVETEIINGLKPDVLRKALVGEKGLGTIIKSF